MNLTNRHHLDNTKGESIHADKLCPHLSPLRPAAHHPSQRRMQLLLSILKWHRKGVSYAHISEMLGIPRSTAFVMAMRSRNMEPTALEISDPDAGLEDRLLGAAGN